MSSAANLRNAARKLVEGAARYSMDTPMHVVNLIYDLETALLAAERYGGAPADGAARIADTERFDASTALFRAIQVAIQTSTDATDGNISTFSKTLREQGYEVRLVDGTEA